MSKITTARTLVVAAMLIATAGLTGWVARSERIVPNRQFSDFPMKIGMWQGFSSELNRNVFNVLGVEDYVLADYTNPGGERVNLYVGFYQSQKQGDIIHSPKNCLPGAGWKITDSGTETVRFRGQPTKVARLLIQKDGARQVVLYWFQSRGRIISSEYMQKIWLVTDAITRRRTDGSFVRLISPVRETQNGTVTRLKTFAETIEPYLSTYIPS